MKIFKSFAKTIIASLVSKVAFLANHVACCSPFGKVLTAIRDSRLPLAIMFYALSAPLLEAQIFFSNTTLLDTNWNDVKIQDTTAGHNATFSSGQALSGGNPGAYRRTQFTFSVDGSQTSQGETIGHLLNEATYDPSKGTLYSLAYSLDAIINSESGGTPALTIGLAVLQGGIYYVHEQKQFSQIGTWTNLYEFGLISPDFSRIGTNGPAYPDFSSGGSLIQFGFTTGSAGTNSGTISFDTGVDNFTVILNVTDTFAASFGDNALQDTNWSDVKILDTTVDQTATFTSGQALSGGNPGAYRRTQFTFNVINNQTSQAEIIAHTLRGATYDPSKKGTIYSISYSLDGIIISESGGTPALTMGLTLLQGGVYYIRFPQFADKGLWTNISEVGLHSQDFLRIGTNGPAYPDFSTAGTLIQIGYITGSGGTFAGDINFDTGTDNFFVKLNSYLPPVLVNPQISGGDFIMTIVGLIPGQNVILQSSPDLYAWTSLQTNTPSGIALSITNLMNPSFPTVFLRALVK